MYENSGRIEIKDQKIIENISDEKFENTLFIRLVATKKKFTKVSFKYGIFDAAYLRDCVFDNCDFTGCRFLNSNLIGSSFNGCKFDYATFEKTQIDNDILNNCCPSWENLQLKFARSLRLNYQQLGDSKSANIAMNVELKATEIHHKKAWSSNTSYYRKKYKGWNRWKAFINWFDFKVLDIIWGNGESLWKFSRTVMFLLILISVLDVVYAGNTNNLKNYWNAFLSSPLLFLSVKSVPEIPPIWIAIIYFCRLMMFTFFMAILIKRFNRR